MTLHGIRRGMQWVSLIGPKLSLGFIKTKQVYQGPLKSACVPFLSCHSCPSAFSSCPVGTAQHFMTIQRIPFTLMGFILGIGMLVGGMACGWLCPLGLIQELMYKIRSKKIRIPHHFSVLRYFALVFLVILIPLVTHATWFSKLCPMGTLQAGLPWVLWNPIIPVYDEPAVSPGSLGALFVIKLLILVLFLGLFIVSKRPFCRTVCPLGAVFGLFNKVSLVQLTVDRANCKDCSKCVQRCPVDLCVGDDPNATTCVRCLNCLDCENVHIEMRGPEKGVDLSGWVRSEKQ